MGKDCDNRCYFCENKNCIHGFLDLSEFVEKLEEGEEKPF